MPTLLGLLTWVGLAGCGRPGEVVFPFFDTSDPGVPEVWVSPTRIDFEASVEPQFRTCSISNVGDGDLEILELLLEGDSTFTLLGDAPPATLAPGTSTELLLQYVSGSAWTSASIWLRTDDPGNPIEQIYLVGEPIAPELYITPSSVDFGSLTPGCEESRELVLINLGKADLELQNLQYTTDNQWLRVSDAPAIPLTLPPGEATTITISFAPTGEGVDAGSLLVFSTDPDALATATQVGEAAWEWVHVDGMQLLPVDLVLVVDQSASMFTELTRVAENIGTLVQALDAAELDWQAAVVADEDGCLQGDLVTSATSDPTDELASAITSFGATNVEGRLLKLLYQATLRADEDDCNERMLRDDALLHGVLVTDEPHTDGDSPAYWVQELLQVVSTQERLAISAIAGDVPGGCSGANPGSGYDEAVEATDGIFLSICSEVEQLERLVEVSQRAVVQLPSAPDPDTLTVRVDGMGWTDGWHLDETRDLVVFDTQPDREAEVDVDYGRKGCD
jgi:hypothetical protein